MIGNDEGTNLYAYVFNSAVNLTDPTGMYKLVGFPGSKEGQMNDAIHNAINTLKNGCSSCAGSDAPKIAHALETATFVYKPDLDVCAYTPLKSMLHVSNQIEISKDALDSPARCCSLASTLTHEASHFGAWYTESSAYALEKKWFNCGTGHPPQKQRKGN